MAVELFQRQRHNQASEVSNGLARRSVRAPRADLGDHERTRKSSTRGIGTLEDQNRIGQHGHSNPGRSFLASRLAIGSVRGLRQAVTAMLVAFYGY